MKRRLWKFHGGIHPPQNKHQSVQQAIRKLPLPERLILPLQQHIGAPAEPIVEIGETVLKGQALVQGNGFVSASLHAPTSGSIEDIGYYPIQHPSQLPGKCIVIKTDGKDQWLDTKGIENYREHEPQKLIETIQAAGIIGLGGAGFPSHVKLSVQQPIETLILNAAECEPYITADDMLMRERAANIIEGLEIIAYIVNAQQILVGIEDNKPEAIAAMTEATQNSAVEIVTVPTIYPSGGEKQIIKILTGKEVPSGGLPADIGIVCHNTGTAYAVRQAIVEGKPLISRITTFTGDGISEPGNAEVLLGTPVNKALQAFDVEAEKIHRLVMGGPMMGFSITNAEVPIVKITNCIIAADEKELPDPAPEQACIRCGSCTEVCPAQLLPQQMYFYTKSKEFNKAAHYNLFDCIECGACSYVCPSHIPLVQYFRFGKGEIRKHQAETVKSDNARERFEARQQRLEREAAEKEAKRKARQAAAKQKTKAVEPVVANAETNDDLETLKNNAAKAAKQFQQAKKALQTAEKNNTGNLDKMRDKILELEKKSNAARDALKAARKNTPPENNPPPSAESNSAAGDEIEKLRTISNDASENLKALKKSLLSAKSSNAANLEQLTEAVSKAKQESDNAKKNLRLAIQAQKQSPTEVQAETPKASATPSANHQLIIQSATARTELKKAQQALEQASTEGADENTLKQLQSNVDAAQQKLDALNNQTQKTGNVH